MNYHDFMFENITQYICRQLTTDRMNSILISSAIARLDLSVKT